jgi:hypothetical protein
LISSTIGSIARINVFARLRSSVSLLFLETFFQL